MFYSKAANSLIVLGLAILLCFCSQSNSAKSLSDEPEELVQSSGVHSYHSYSDAVGNWESIYEVADWMGNNFSYDFERAVELSESNRAQKTTVGVYSPSELFLKRKGVCIDLARFGVETARIIYPESFPKYVMIEFTPITISGKVIRKHWIASFQKDGKYYFFADSKRPGYISGPVKSVAEYMNQYEKYRDRKIVSYKELDSFKKKKRLKKKNKRKPTNT